MKEEKEEEEEEEGMGDQWPRVRGGGDFQLFELYFALTGRVLPFFSKPLVARVWPTQRSGSSRGVPPAAPSGVPLPSHPPASMEVCKIPGLPLKETLSRHYAYPGGCVPGLWHSIGSRRATLLNCFCPGHVQVKPEDENHLYSWKALPCPSKFEFLKCSPPI